MAELDHEQLLSNDSLAANISSGEKRNGENANESDNQISIFQAVTILVITITGIGILSVPYCFRAGVFLNLILTFFLASISFITFTYLIKSASITGINDYSQLMTVAINNKFVPVVNIILIIVLFGVGTIYMQYSMSLTSAFLKNFKGVPEWCFNRWFLVLVPNICIEFPLMCLKTMQKLSFVSAGSMVLVFIYFLHTLFYFAKSVKENGFDPQKELKYFDFGKIFLSAIGIQATSYTCHPNIFPALTKLKNGTNKRKITVMACVTVCAYLIYSIPGLLGYFTLFDKILDPVAISYYPKGQIFTYITELLYAMLTVLCIPLILFACRLSVNDTFFKTEFTTLRWNLIGFLLLFCGAIIAITVKQIGSIFNIIGGVLCPIVAYTLPAIYYLRIAKPLGFLMIFACFVALFGLTIICVSMYNTFK